MLTTNMLAFILLFVLPIQILGAHLSMQNQLLTSTRNFCNEHSNWLLVKYKDLHVTSPHGNVKGIRALENSCITFPYTPETDSIIIIHVFMQVSSMSSGIDVSLFRDAETSPYETYVYKKANDLFSRQWHDLVIHVEADTHFIRVSGTSSNQDIIIVDSFESISNDLIDSEKHITKNLLAPVEIIEQDDTFIFQNVREKRNNDEIELKDEETTDVPVPEENEEKNGFWTPLTISLISIAGIAVVAGLLGVAYYFGTSRSENLLTNDYEEPPRTVTIPRVRDVYN